MWAQLREHPKQADLCAVLLLGAVSNEKLSLAEVQTMADAESVAVKLDATWLAEADAEPLSGKATK